MVFLDDSNIESWTSCSSAHRQLDVLSRQALTGLPRWFPQPLWPYQPGTDCPAGSGHRLPLLCGAKHGAEGLLQSGGRGAGAAVVLHVFYVGLGFDLTYSLAGEVDEDIFSSQNRHQLGKESKSSLCK